MNEIPEIISYTKDLIFALDKYRDSIEPIPQVIKELIQLGKTFHKIEVKLNEYEQLLNLTPAFLQEGTSCLSLLRETLVNIQTQLNIYVSHTENADSISDKIWFLFNSGQIHTHFQTFAEQIKGHAEHLLKNFLPILNMVINNSFEKEKILQSIHKLTSHEREKICSVIMRDNNIMKLYLPSGASKKAAPPTSDTSPLASSDTAAVTMKAPASEEDVNSIVLEKQSSASCFLVNAKTSSHQAHHEASDVRDETRDAETLEERPSLTRFESFSAVFGGAQRRPSSNSRSNSITSFFLGNNPTKNEETASLASSPATLSRNDRASFTAPPAHGEFDVHPDYYHIKWFIVLPQIWRDYPHLTFGQIKYIYLTQPFFTYYHDDIYFINHKTIEESAQLQVYLEGVEEFPPFRQEDYEYVAKLIHNDKNMLVKRLIQLLNTRFEGRREFSFLLLLGSELLSTKSRTYEKILLDAVHQFPAEEGIWPEGDINLDWTVLHAIQKRHQHST